ncbi:hypothetical protein [Teredinibacter haidensis]|mgnify:CR=1 FL=1|uniref:hypothetical protein n=1 Tax=Teredinibacter haidensis TaxID=2731755 RepID=UPI000948BD9F|nr:hypothetical protein [Teredinibacter haidensis]
MNNLRLALSVLTLCSSLAYIPYTAAETSSELTTKVERYQASISNKGAALETVENRLLAYEAKKDDAASQLDAAKVDLREAQSNLTQAKIDTSEDSARKQDMAQRRLELAERAVQSREKRLERVMRKFEELSAEKEKLENDISWLKDEIPSLTSRAKTLSTRERQPAAAPQPIKIASPLPAATPRPAPIATPEPPPVVVESEDTPIAKTIQTAVVAAAPVKTGNNAASQDLTPRQLYAREEMHKLNELTKTADKREHRRYNELLMEIDRNEVVELEYMGNEQFYTETQLTQGKHKLTINLRKFSVTIPEKANGDTYVVIYDTTNIRNARFVIFNKKLLD